MPKSGFRKNAGWKGYKFAINPKGFAAELKKQLLIHANRVGMIAERQVKKTIQVGGFKPNAPLTVAIKGSSKPLIDQADLFAAMTFKVISWSTVFVGVFRTNENYNVARAVHNGAVISVTDRMRGLFLALWKVSTGEMDENELTSQRAQQLWERNQEWFPLKASTTAITIPARPFMLKAFADPQMREMVKKQWLGAVKKVIEKRSRKGKKA
ncbi:MAG: hypothetical protein DRJ65_07340 [Acidobacteria bacterium]|nr:MAG: hypothetical protein DRJ65_07340 [Acidobacteriota bacterium]